MNNYPMLSSEIGLTSEIIGLATGTIEIPNCSTEQPARCYGYPPALIPFWSDPDGMIYTGLWKHWFSNRPSSFVNMYVNVLFRVDECACTTKQFLQSLVLKEIVFAGDLNERIKTFANRLNVENVDGLYEHALIYGDNPAEFKKLSGFQVDLPLICFKDQTQYEGNFPHVGMFFNRKNMSSTCSLELDETLEKQYLSNPSCPDWFKNKDKKVVFHYLLNDGKLSEAWLTLNSNGWTFEEAKDAMSVLACKSDDVAFHALAETWCSLEHSKYKIGY